MNYDTLKKIVILSSIISQRLYCQALSRRFISKIWLPPWNCELFRCYDNGDELTPEKLQAYQKAQGEIGAALGRLLAITENYPELKANENFKELQAQLEGTENRISVERRNFNEVARSYNTSIRTFPKTLIASMCGFDKRPYFEAEEGANKAPEVKF